MNGNQRREIEATASEMSRIINLRNNYDLCGVPKSVYEIPDFAAELRLKEITKKNREAEEMKKIHGSSPDVEFVYINGKLYKKV